MTNITEANSFDAVVARYDTTDPVIGGIGGQSNSPIIALANRSRYLYNYQNSYTDVVAVNSNTLISAAYLRKLIYINASANITLQLAAISTFLPGQVLCFKCANAAGKCVSILPAAGEMLKDGTGLKNIWLYNGESISLVVRSSTEWEILNPIGNFDIVGNDGMARTIPKNTLVADGTGGLLRSDYPRLWAIIAASVIDESSWLSDPLSYRQYFTAGNGTTTFRLPDMRSMMWRGLDMGRGISYARYGSAPGAYEMDGNKAHNHTNGVFKKLLKVDGTQTSRDTDSTSWEPNLIASADMLDSGNSEATVKNVGLVPIIYF